jgi:putative phage-type endonuclease
MGDPFKRLRSHKQSPIHQLLGIRNKQKKTKIRHAPAADEFEVGSLYAVQEDNEDDLDTEFKIDGGALAFNLGGGTVLPTPNAAPVPDVHVLGVRPSHAFVITRSMQQAILDDICIRDADHVRQICNYPQRSEEWLCARKGRMTGSRMGALIGMCPYSTADRALSEFLHSTFSGNKFTAHGTLCESYALKSFTRLERSKHPKHLKIDVAVPGLIVHEKMPMFAYSADMIIIFSPNGGRRLGEIKCPYFGKAYPRIPPQYMCQMQMGMYVLGIEECEFVVYTAKGPAERNPKEDRKTFVTRVKRDNAFIFGRMLPRALKMYFKRYLPLQVAHDLNMVKPGTTILPKNVRVEDMDVPVVEECEAEHRCLY